MSFYNLRGDIVKALACEDALRTHETAIYDQRKRAMLTKDLGASLQLHCGYEEPLPDILIALGILARAPDMRTYVNFIGGQNSEPWNHWEWSLPPSMIDVAKQVVNG